MRIVIVEDEIRIREGLANLIRKIAPQYRIIGEAEDGSAGIRVIEEKKPDLVITDVRMPDMDGLEMLGRLKERSIRTRAIVLSAYSEFSYAREAIKLGVSEYLLKPVNALDLSRALKNVEDELAAEAASRKSGGTRSLESALYSILSGDGYLQDRDEKLLGESYRLDVNGPFALLSLYLGDKFPADGGRLALLVKSLISRRVGTGHCVLEQPKAGKLAILLYAFDGGEEEKRWVASVLSPELRRDGCENLVCAWISFTGLSNLKSAMQRLDSCLDWSIVLPEGTLISCPEADATPCVPLSYPIAIESQVRAALCAGSEDRYESGIDEFLRYFHSDRTYSPKDIKESFIRFFWAVLNAAREVAYDKYEGLAQQEILEKITSAVTWSELSSVATILLRLAPEKAAWEGDGGSIVNRAKNLAHEFYGQGITLEEIASKISVTPEYLSAQFHRQTGVNFSAYIKDYRIRKAKELLLGTDLKLYAVAEKVGYQDAKYFCRVFKESTGRSPSDYRKTNR
jgi:two-component system response regulator YesN